MSFPLTIKPLTHLKTLHEMTKLLECTPTMQLKKNCPASNEHLTQEKVRDVEFVQSGIFILFFYESVC